MSTKTFKVLFGPGNIASIPDNTMFALNKIENVEAWGIAEEKHHYLTFRQRWKFLSPLTSIRKNPFKRIYQEIRNKLILFQYIWWADVIVWNWDIGKYPAKIIRLLGKRIYVEWLGSDIRIPELVMLENPQYKISWESGEYAYKMESRERSLNIQKKFKSINAIPLLCPEMSLFLDRSIFNSHQSTFQPINLESFNIFVPQINNHTPVLVHTPSNTGAKGTKYVRNSIEELRIKQLNFEYIEITGKTRLEALEAISKADIFIDQFVSGGYGMATCEALAMGKPVISYIMPSVKNIIPKECPIINSNVNELTDTLHNLIENAPLRNTIGIQSRQYIEKYHDADQIARELVRMFQEDLKKR